MIENPKGNYRFLKGGGPFSSGCRAEPGYEIVHAVFRSLPSLDEGYRLIEHHLASLKRPMQALCGMELRIPEPLPPEGFLAFNEPYIERLKAWDLFLGDINPVARTNVALERDRVAEPVVHGFSYTVPSGRPEPTLVVAGAGEMESASFDDIVRRGDTSADGLAEKAKTVLKIMSKRLAGLEAGWPQVTAIDIYCVHDIHAIMQSTILPELGKAAQRGIHWYHSRPPVLDIDYEMDVRVVHQEIVLP